MTRPTLTYPDAPATLIAVWNERRAPLHLPLGERMPGPDADLAALAAQRLPDPPLPRPPRARGHTLKRHALAVELAGLSELVLTNALCITHLRKWRCPREVAPLFHRIWEEQGAALLAELPTRWLISSAITFADHGRTEGERRLGQSLNVLFSLMKLYEHERLASGLPTDAPVAKRRRAGAALPMGMGAFSPLTGGLDVNLLAPIWAAAGGEPVLGPIALRLLDLLNAEPGGLFRRLALMRDATADRRAVRIARRATPPLPPSSPAEP